jgi:DNA-binding LytR/AlgR family response regulator
MNTLNVLIVDDEPLARSIIEGYFGKITGFIVVASCKNALESFSVLSKQKIDLVLLDINMPEISGIELLKTLKNPPAIIFTTAYSEYAVTSYELNAVDYLLKPISFERFLKAIDKAKQVLYKSETQAIDRADTQSDLLFVKSDRKLIKIDLGKLLFIEGLKDYIRLWIGNERIIVHATMKSMEEQLSQRKNFVRVSKSYIINIKYVSEVNGNSIRINDQLIAIGNTYREDVISLFNKYKLL